VIKHFVHLHFLVLLHKFKCQYLLFIAAYLKMVNRLKLAIISKQHFKLYTGLEALRAVGE